MKAIVFEKFGSSEVLQTKEVATPIAKAGEVLIRLTHTSVNPVDWKIREGYLQKMLPHQFPIIPGWDAAGTVATVGEGVTSVKTGDAVFAYARLPEVHSGTYAEYIAIPESFVAKIPNSLSLEKAAGVPLVGLTAYQALHEIAHVTKGNKVFINGGAGGVGSYAIQFAKAAGATVVASAGPKNQDYVRSLGAIPVDYTQSNYAETARAMATNGFDIVFDAVGGESLKTAATLLREGGNLVSIVETPTGGKFHFVYPNGKQLGEIARLFDEGKVISAETQLMSVKRAATAQDENRKGHGRGKIVLTIDF